MSLIPVSPRRPLVWPACVEAIRAALADEPEVYLVGGAVRDAYLHRPLRDLDLAIARDGRPLARHIANVFQGDYYTLDAERGVGRAIIAWEGASLTIDVTQFRGPDLLTDLQNRDFTLNAMAVPLASDLTRVLDPLGGLHDLEAKRLRECSPDSITSDPVRALRAVRVSVTHQLMIEPGTRQHIKTYASRLADVSAERVRDEFFQILASPRPSAALNVLRHLGALTYVIPSAAAMPGVMQRPPHQFDVWQHTLSTIEHLDHLLSSLNPRPDQDLTANVQIGLITVALHNIRGDLRDHLTHQWPNGRTHRALLILAALLHDAGKPATRRIDENGVVRFIHHEQVGAKLAEEQALALRLSNEETERLMTVVHHHMRPHWLHNDSPPSARAIYRFWRDTGLAGVDICLLAMSDHLGTYGVTLDSQAWVAYLGMIQTLLERYYLHHRTAISPPPLITGQVLLDYFGLKPGPLIGKILENLNEAQAVGDITTYEEALEWVQHFLKENA